MLPFSASSHERYDFDQIARLQSTCRMLLARYNLAISLDRTVTIFNLQFRKQVGNRPRFGNCVRLTVQLNFHRLDRSELGG